VTGPTYRDVKASGIRLRVTDVGSGPTLLLLHTALLDRTCWNQVLAGLVGSFRVVAPDLPGFGESEKPQLSRFDYSIGAFAHVVTDLFAGLGLGQAYIAGHGLGGAIAVAIASQSSELVSRLMLIDAWCYPHRRDVVRGLAAIPMLGGFVFKQLWSKPLFTVYCREVLTAKATVMSHERIEHYYGMFNTPAARSSAHATFRATADTRAVVANIARITVATLVIWGRHDAVYPAVLGQRLSREMHRAGFQLLDAGHVPCEEQPALLAESIRKFSLAERA
jgi:pimeloyl-ACP methyl ester carboxylesterase